MEQDMEQGNRVAVNHADTVGSVQKNHADMVGSVQKIKKITPTWSARSKNDASKNQLFSLFQ